MEIWDLYTELREVTGKEHIRGEEIPEGYYHLVTVLERQALQDGLPVLCLKPIWRNDTINLRLNLRLS